jgi:hypothetical protein
VAEANPELSAEEVEELITEIEEEKQGRLGSADEMFTEPGE